MSDEQATTPEFPRAADQTPRDTASSHATEQDTPARADTPQTPAGASAPPIAEATTPNAGHSATERYEAPERYLAPGVTQRHDTPDRNASDEESATYPAQQPGAAEHPAPGYSTGYSTGHPAPAYSSQPEWSAPAAPPPAYHPYPAPHQAEPTSQPPYQQPGYPQHVAAPHPGAAQWPLYPEPGSFGPPPTGPGWPGGPTGPSGPHGPTGGATPKPPRGPRRNWLITAVIAALIGGGVGAGTVAATDNGQPAASAGLAFSTQQAPADKLDGTVSAAAAKIGPSVVTITVTSQREQDTGSGVIIRNDGYILTNNHVISTATNGGGRIEVTYSDGKTSSATIVGTDPSDDLAVIKVDETGLTAATFASSSALQVGQTVVAVGAPLGLSDTVTAGIVSTLTRPVTTSDNQNTASFNAIQTDAAINPGNSGGPLVNLNGDVVGINAAIATDQSQGGLQVPGQQSEAGNIGIGFAIPSDEASRIAGELIATGKATHAVMGVTVGNNPSGSIGALVKSVVAGSPAAKAGMKPGDVVIKLESQRIDDANALVAAVRSYAPGQQVSVQFVRSGDTQTTTMTLGTGTD